jgi:hypothetical protein
MIPVKQSADSATITTKSSRRTDGSKFFTPDQAGGRWGWHPESIRRAIRQKRIASIIISRRRLIPISEIERIEAEGLITRVV